MAELMLPDIDFVSYCGTDPLGFDMLAQYDPVDPDFYQKNSSSAITWSAEEEAPNADLEDVEKWIANCFAEFD